MPTITAPPDPTEEAEPTLERPRRHPRALLALVLAGAAGALWICALVCGATGMDAHTVATCSFASAIAGAALAVTALESIARDPDRWGGVRLARASAAASAAAIGLNVAAFTSPFAA